MTGSRAQWYNGVLLLSSFFACRLLWGTYQSIRVYQDVWAGLHYDPSARVREVFEPYGESDEVMRYAGGFVVPGWLACVYLGSNIVLNTLNFYWFGKMIETVKSRFRDPADKKKGEVKVEGVMVEGLADSSTIIDAIVDSNGTILEGGVGVKGNIVDARGRTLVEVEKKEVRKRRG